MDKLYEIIKKVKKSPELYLGKKSLERLDAFISGYIVACDNNIEYFPGFSEFIQDRFNIHDSHRDTEIIQFYSMSDEEAFYQYFELLDEFLNKEYNSDK